MIVDSFSGECYDPVMVAKKLEKLESLVSTAVGELRNLRAENQRITKELSKLEKKLGEVQDKNARVEIKLRKVPALEVSNRKLQDEKKKVRMKVETIMQELEKFDIPG
jgi:predicted RNase H-like nuclease (RuvC/YqgF family)